MSDLLLGQIYTIGLIIYAVCILGHLIAVKINNGYLLDADLDAPILYMSMSPLWFMVLIYLFGYLLWSAFVEYIESFNKTSSGGDSFLL